MPHVRLRVLLPKEGFRWFSGRGNFFLTNKQCRIIAQALRHTAMVQLTDELVAERFVEIFAVANEHIDQCAKMEPQDFWAAVGQEIPWTREGKNIDGELIYDLSLLFLSARAFQRNDASDLAELELISPEAMREMMGNTEVTRAVDAFSHSIWKAYPMGSEIREKYIPKYTQESHNEGSTEATDAEFQRQISENSGPKPAPNSAEVWGQAKRNMEEMGMGDEYNQEDDDDEYDDDDDEEDYGDEFHEDGDDDTMDWEPEEEDQGPSGSAIAGDLMNLAMHPK